MAAYLGTTHDDAVAPRRLARRGGGQILRISLALSAMTGRAIRVEKIRAGRKNPGLAAQHLTAVRAVGAICGAEVGGGRIGSRELTFSPKSAPQPGDYVFDVAEAREGGSTGSATLLLQALLVPLASAKGDSTLVLRGGTHVAWSPPFDYAKDVFLPALSRMSLTVDIELMKWGWFPAGGGEIRVRIRGGQWPKPLVLPERGRLAQVRGRAVAANLPSHFAQRMADRARSLLGEMGLESRVEALRVRAACPGAGIFLTAEYENVSAGFNALGRRGLSCEAVAERAVAALKRHRDSGAALDAHLADQVLLPMAPAEGESGFTVERVSRHLTTNAWVIEQFGLGRVRIHTADGESGRVRISGGGETQESLWNPCPHQ